MALIHKKLKVPRFAEAQIHPRGLTVFAMMYAPHIVVVDRFGAVVAGHQLPPRSSLVGMKWVNATTLCGLLVQYATTYAERFALP